MKKDEVLVTATTQTTMGGIMVRKRSQPQKLMLQRLYDTKQLKQANLQRVD